MTRGAVALTHRSIEALRPGEVPYRISDQRCIDGPRGAKRDQDVGLFVVRVRCDEYRSGASLM